MIDSAKGLLLSLDNELAKGIHQLTPKNSKLSGV